MHGLRNVPVAARIVLAILLAGAALAGPATAPRPAAAAGLPAWHGGIDLYRSGVFVAAIFPTKGVAEGLPYVVVRPNQKFTARWTGGTPGVTATFAIILDDGT